MLAELEAANQAYQLLIVSIKSTCVLIIVLLLCVLVLSGVVPLFFNGYCVSLCL